MFGLMGVARMAGQPGGAWSPLRLFAASEQGVWYDPSDFSSIFQDSAGTTPVTAVEQPVGLILDKRLGLARGAELVASQDLTTWTSGGGFGNWNGSTATATTITSIGIDGARYIRLAAAPGKTYRVTANANIQAGPATEARLVIAFGTSGGGYIDQAPFSTTSSAPALVTGVAIAPANTAFVEFVVRPIGADGSSATFTDISAYEIPGNHATQPTAAARPVVSARKNWLTYTEDFTDAAWGAYSGATKSTSAFTFVNSNSYIQHNTNLTSGVVVGSTVTLSLTLSSDTAQTLRLVIIDGADGDPNYPLDVNVTTTPTRFDHTATLGAGFSGYLTIQLAGSNVIAAGTVVTVSEPQLEIGSTATAYQRVTTASDYDSVGFPHYLAFDGIDDLLATTFPDLGTDVTIARAVPFVGASILTEIGRAHV